MPFAFLFFLLPWFVNPLQKIFFSEELNKRTASSQRATVLSLSSFGAQGLQILFLPVIGYVADWYGLQTMYLLFASILLIVGFIAFFGLRRALMFEKVIGD